MQWFSCSAGLKRGTLPLTSPTRGTKLQASPCSLSASTRGSDYPAFQFGTGGKPRTNFEAFFSVVHKAEEKILGNLSAALKSCRKKKGIRETWSAFCDTSEITKGSSSSNFFYKIHLFRWNAFYFPVFNVSHFELLRLTRDRIYNVEQHFCGTASDEGNLSPPALAKNKGTAVFRLVSAAGRS